MLRQVLPTQINDLGEDEVEAVISSGYVARDGHVLLPEGAQLDDFKRNPIILWSHQPTEPVGRAVSITVDSEKITARIRFAPDGVSDTATRIKKLVKNNIINAMSVGFEIEDAEPLNPKQPHRGLKITRWTCLEASFVAVPADVNAVITSRDWNTLADSLPEGLRERIMAKAMERADGADDWKVGAARNLPIEDSDSWDGPAAEASIFEHAGGDDFDPAKARKGFLLYNASAPKLRGSYRDPIAHVVGGELKVPKGAIRAAASRLPQTDVPDNVKSEAEAVLNHYKEKAGIGENEGRAEDTEEDGTEEPRAEIVPERREATQAAAMIGRDLLGDNDAVLVLALTREEIAAVLRGRGEGDMETETRAGKKLSAEMMDKMNEAETHHKRALENHKGAERCRSGMEERCDGMRSQIDEAMQHHRAMGDAMNRGDMEACRSHHESMKRNMNAISDQNTGLGDDHEEMGDHHDGIRRHVRAAQRACRIVSGAAEPGVDNDAAAMNNPMAGAHAVDDGDWEKRQAAKKALRVA